ncbi:MAG: oligoendopeptidase F [Candidatus Nanohaloarchaea archaeon]
MVEERSEIDDEHKWSIENMFSSEEEWREEVEEIRQDMEKLSEFEGEVTDSASDLKEVLELKNDISRRLESVKKFAHMKRDQDTRNQDAQAMLSQAKSLGTDFSRETSFIVPEIVEAGQGRIREFLEMEEELEDYEHFFDDIFRMKNHILESDQEEILSSLGDVNDAAQETYSTFTNADLTFPEIEDPEGEKVEITQSNFVKMQKHQDRGYRKRSFEALYDRFGEFRNTVTTTLSKQVRKNVRMAEIKNFDTARRAALKPDNIPVEVYDNLVDTVNDNVDLLQRLVELKKKELGVDELKMYDLYMPVAESESPDISYQEAKEHILEALQPLDEDYVEKVREGLEEEKWVDIYENKGKRSGAYSGGSYDSRPFILMNYQDDINSMYTLIHELGHSMHSHHTNQNQPYHYSNYTIFQAEVASTTNEALLTRHLLETVEDENFRKHVLSHVIEGFRGTLFRQTMFSEFEKWLHEEVENGEALTPDKLNEKYGELKQHYYQNAEIGERIRREWMRIPHFYYNFYVFQYATGISAGNMFAEKIVEEGPEDYRDFLRAGGSEYSLKTLQEAGVDLRSTEPVEEAISTFEKHLEQMEKLVD